MNTFPIMLGLRGRRTVVVGAGPVGLRKARSLRRAGAAVKVVDPLADPEALPDGVEAVRAAYEPEHVAGAFLVFACTDDAGLNARVAADARSAGALVNVADTPDECDFYLPAMFRAGCVEVAVGTGGSVPALSAWLRRGLEAALPEKLAEFAAALEDARIELRAAEPDVARRMAVMKQLVRDETHRAFLDAGPAAVRAELHRLLGG